MQTSRHGRGASDERKDFWWDLHAVRILELGERGPIRFCGMLLSDIGAEVITLDRPCLPDDITPLNERGLGRGRRKVKLDLRDESNLRTARAIVAEAAGALVAALADPP